MEIILGAIIGAVATIFVTIWRTKKERQYAQKDRRSEMKPEKLKYHRIHQKLYQFKLSVNHNIKCDYKGKEKMIKDFLKGLLEIYIQIVDDISDKVDNTEMSDTELCEYNMEKFKEAIEKRSNFFYNSEYSDDKQKALKLFMEFYDDFNAGNIERFFDDIRTICFSKYYTNNVVRQSFIFERYISEFVRIIIWTSERIDEINGEFLGYTYGGYQIYEEQKEGEQNE